MLLAAPAATPADGSTDADVPFVGGETARGLRELNGALTRKPKGTVAALVAELRDDLATLNGALDGVVAAALASAGALEAEVEQGMEAMAAEWHAHGVRQAQQQAAGDSEESAALRHQLAQYAAALDAAQRAAGEARAAHEGAARDGAAARQAAGEAQRAAAEASARAAALEGEKQAETEARGAAERAAAAERRGVEAAQHAAAGLRQRGAQQAAAYSQLEAAHAQLTLAHREASERAAAAQLLEQQAAQRTQQLAQLGAGLPPNAAAPLAQLREVQHELGLAGQRHAQAAQALGAAHQQLRQLDAERLRAAAHARALAEELDAARAHIGIQRARSGQPAAPAGGVGGTDAAAAVETVTAKLSEGFSWLKSASAKVSETAIGAIGDLRSVAGGGDDGRSGA